MSFRQYGGINYSAKNNIIKNNLLNSNNLNVSNAVGQPNSYINFLSDIGIGISSPSYSLDVNGDINFTGQLFENGSPYLGTTQWTTSGLNIYYNTGNVGIGISTPTFDLDIDGDINFTGQLLKNGLPISETSQWTTSGSNIYYNTGYVGIGTSTPSFDLDITGNMRINSSNPIDTNGVFKVELTGANLLVYKDIISNIPFTSLVNTGGNTIEIGSSIYSNNLLITGDVAISKSTITESYSLDVSGNLLTNGLLSTPNLSTADLVIYAGNNVALVNETYSQGPSVSEYVINLSNKFNQSYSYTTSNYSINQIQISVNIPISLFMSGTQILFSGIPQATLTNTTSISNISFKIYKNGILWDTITPTISAGAVTSLTTTMNFEYSQSPTLLAQFNYSYYLGNYSCSFIVDKNDNVDIYSIGLNIGNFSSSISSGQNIIRSTTSNLKIYLYSNTSTNNSSYYFSPNQYLTTSIVFNPANYPNTYLAASLTETYTGNVSLSGTTFSNRLIANTIQAQQSITVNGPVNAIAFNQTSDYRIKDNVIDLDNIYSIDNIRPVKYWNKITQSEDLGLIAHELEEVYPFLVNGKKDGEKYQSINYIGIIAILINEIKALKNTLKHL